jgi:hypothetical protein
MGQLTTQRTPTCDRLKVSEFVVQPSDEVGKAIGTEIIRDSVRCQNGDVNLGAFEAARGPDTTTAKGTESRWKTRILEGAPPAR